MHTLLQDLRLATRQLRRSPGFSATAVLILALGIAASVIVFGVLRGLVLEPVNVPHGDRVMTLARTSQTYPVFSYPDVRDVRDGNSVFSAVSAWTIFSYGLDVDGASRPVWSWVVGGEYFEVVGVKPFLGRLLDRADDDHRISDAAVLSWTTWKNAFHADPTVVGKTVRINKYPYTIVGVAPEGFYGTEKFLQPDIFIPVNSQAAFAGSPLLESRRDWNTYAIVRLKDGVSLSQAQADLNTVASRIRRQNPAAEDGLGLKLARPGLMGDFLGTPVRNFLAGVMALACIVLLAACANIGGLFAARTADRTREIAIRIAIGSSRWRIVRQLLFEALVVSFLGGLCACSLAWFALKALGNWRLPTEYPLRFHITPSFSTLLFAMLISTVAGVLFGMMPLWQIFRTDPNDAIKSGLVLTPAGRRWAFRDLLLAAQVALCCVTVTAAFVSLRGLRKALTMNVGVNTRHAVVTKFELSQAGYSTVTADQFQRRLLESVLHLPGVQTAAYSSATPLSGDTSTSSVFTQQTVDLIRSKQAFDTFEYSVSPGYFTATETMLLEGRDFRWTDTAKTPFVAVVNQQFARHLFHSEHVVGRYFKTDSGHSYQIVGVVADGKYLSLSEDPQEVAFYPIAQQPRTSTWLVVRMRPGSTDFAVAEMAATIRKAVHNLDSSIPIRDSSPWNRQLTLIFFPAQIATISLGVFGVFGLLLSITGTFGLASYTVTKRLRELSIRVALGAPAKEILATALGRMLTLLGIGSVIGMLLGAGASHLLSAIVYQASARDPFVLLAVAATALLTGALAVAGPVRRALHMDPAQLLREQ